MRFSNIHSVARMFAVASLAAVTFTSCQKNSMTSRVVVSVGDAELTMSQLIAATPPVVATPEDSAVYADEYVREWVFKQVLLQKAVQNIGSEFENIDRAVEEYRTSLIIETYQNKLVDQKFNPNITQSDIEEYYATKKEEFILRDPIIKGVYAVLPSTSPDIKNFEKTLQKFDAESALEVEKYLYKYSSNYKISTDAWVPLASIKKFFPANSVPDDGKALKSSRLFKYEHEGNIYLLKVTDARPVNDIPPLEFVSQSIYTTLLSKRKLQFLSNANRELYDQAVKDNAIKFYDNND